MSDMKSPRRRTTTRSSRPRHRMMRANDISSVLKNIFDDGTLLYHDLHPSKAKKAKKKKRVRSASPPRRHAKLHVRYMR